VINDPDKPISGKAEKNLVDEPIGATVQFERKFFARVDGKRGEKIVLYYTSK